MAPRKIYTPPFLRQWRTYRNLTQERLAERIGCSTSFISKVEAGKRQYDQEFLEAAAEALDTDPSSLLRIDPTKPGAYDTIFEQLRRVPEADLPRLSAALDALFPASNDEPPKSDGKHKLKRKSG